GPLHAARTVAVRRSPAMKAAASPTSSPAATVVIPWPPTSIARLPSTTRARASAGSDSYQSASPAPSVRSVHRGAVSAIARRSAPCHTELPASSAAIRLITACPPVVTEGILLLGGR